MVVDMKAKNKGKPKSLPGTPAGKNKGNFQQQKKSLSPNSKPAGPGGATPNKGPKGTPGGGKPFAKNNTPGGGPGGRPPFNKNNSPGGGGAGGGGKKFEGKPGFQQRQQQKGGRPDNRQGPKPKQQQNGSGQDAALKQLDPKSKPQFKKSATPNKQSKNAMKKSKSVNRYQRFQTKLNSRVRTPQACARAFKAEQELTASQGRVLKITLPDPIITTEMVSGWSTGIESILFGKPLQARSFTVVLKSGVNVKKELEKFNKISVANGKIIVKEQDTADLGHMGGLALKDPAELIDPYTLYVTNLPDKVNKNELEAFFKESTASQPKKHNPKLGNPSKFAFVTFETPEAALTAFKENFNKDIEGKCIVMRFRRLNQGDLRAQQKAEAESVKLEAKASPADKSKVNATAKAGKVATEVKKQDAKKQNQNAKTVQALKQEPVDADDDDDDEDDDEGMELDMDDEDDSDDGAEGMEEEDDDDDDDDDEEDDDEDDDDDDDDDDE